MMAMNTLLLKNIAFLLCCLESILAVHSFCPQQIQFDSSANIIYSEPFTVANSFLCEVTFKQLRCSTERQFNARPGIVLRIYTHSSMSSRSLQVSVPVDRYLTGNIYLGAKVVSYYFPEESGGGQHIGSILSFSPDETWWPGSDEFRVSIVGFPNYLINFTISITDAMIQQQACNESVAVKTPQILAYQRSHVSQKTRVLLKTDPDGSGTSLHSQLGACHWAVRCPVRQLQSPITNQTVQIPQSLEILTAEVNLGSNELAAVSGLTSPPMPTENGTLGSPPPLSIYESLTIGIVNASNFSRLHTVVLKVDNSTRSIASFRISSFGQLQIVDPHFLQLQTQSASWDNQTYLSILFDATSTKIPDGGLPMPFEISQAGGMTLLYSCEINSSASFNISRSLSELEYCSLGSVTWKEKSESLARRCPAGIQFTSRGSEMTEGGSVQTPVPFRVSGSPFRCEFSLRNVFRCSKQAGLVFRLASMSSQSNNFSIVISSSKEILPETTIMSMEEHDELLAVAKRTGNIVYMLSPPSPVFLPLANQTQSKISEFFVVIYGEIGDWIDFNFHYEARFIENECKTDSQNPAIVNQSSGMIFSDTDGAQPRRYQRGRCYYNIDCTKHGGYVHIERLEARLGMTLWSEPVNKYAENHGRLYRDVYDYDQIILRAPSQGYYRAYPSQAQSKSRGTFYESQYFLITNVTYRGKLEFTFSARMNPEVGGFTLNYRCVNWTHLVSEGQTKFLGAESSTGGPLSTSFSNPNAAHDCQIQRSNFCPSQLQVTWNQTNYETHDLSLFLKTNGRVDIGRAAMNCILPVAEFASCQSGAGIVVRLHAGASASRNDIFSVGGLSKAKIEEAFRNTSLELPENEFNSWTRFPSKQTILILDPSAFYNQVFVLRLEALPTDWFDFEIEVSISGGVKAGGGCQSGTTVMVDANAQGALLTDTDGAWPATASPCRWRINCSAFNESQVMVQLLEAHVSILHQTIVYPTELGTQFLTDFKFDKLELVSGGNTTAAAGSSTSGNVYFSFPNRNQLQSLQTDVFLSNRVYDSPLDVVFLPAITTRGGVTLLFQCGSQNNFPNSNETGKPPMKKQCAWTPWEGVPLPTLGLEVKPLQTITQTMEILEPRTHTQTVPIQTSSMFTNNLTSLLKDLNISTQDPNVTEPVREENYTLSFSVEKFVQVATVGTVAGGALGAPMDTIMDVQSLVLLALMKCKGENEEEGENPMTLIIGSSAPAVTPWNFDPSVEYGGVAGSLIIAGGATVLHASFALGKKFGQRKMSWVSSSAAMRFPSWTIKIYALLYQGICFECFRIYRTGRANLTATGILVGGVGSLTVVAVPAVYIAFHILLLPKLLQFHPFWPCPIPKASGFIKAVVLPCGYWSPKKYRGMFGTLFGSFRPTRGVIWCVYPFIRCIAICFLLTHDTMNCKLRFQILMVIPILTVIGVSVLRPYRSLQSTIFTVIISLLYCAVIVVTSLPDLSNNEKVNYLEKILAVEAPIGFSATAIGFGLKFLEQRWRKVVEEKKEEKKQEKKKKETLKKQKKKSLKRKRYKDKKKERKEARHEEGISSESSGSSDESEEMLRLEENGADNDDDDDVGSQSPHHMLSIPLLNNTGEEQSQVLRGNPLRRE